MTRLACAGFLLLAVSAAPLVAQSPLPPIPAPPSETAPPATLGPAPASAPLLDVRPPAPPPAPVPDDDPFQAAPRDQAPSDNLSRASAAFAARRYAQAATLFAEAARQKEPLTEAQRDEWAYCRLHDVAMRLNRGSEPPAAFATLGREVEDALRSGSDRLQPFGRQLSDEIRRRSGSAGSAPASGGWQVVLTPSFRVLHKGQTALAAEAGETAEAARRAMYERWAGPPAANWSPRCDLYLHPDAGDYTKLTGKPAVSPGHSTLTVRDGRVVSRRIDLRADDPGVLDGPLPSEVTQVLLADLFADQPLPKWALVGMAALSESPEEVARYRRAIPGLLREKKLFAVGPFLDKSDFPTPESITPFYAESVSLVSFLVELRGPKAFAAFLREAPRRGYAKALSTHYGFQDAADLQDKWVKHALGGE
ncbi:MAG TPA: hypothetical protein VKE40_01755 [Gemmataceae bacterium]|nr:hypothetical protein [Gemmataceae bacterium]